MSSETGEKSQTGFANKLEFPFQKLDRWQLVPGVRIVGMRSKAEVEAMLIAVKEAMTSDQVLYLGQITDKTKLTGPTMSHKMFELMARVAAPGESIDVTSASATILPPKRQSLLNKLRKGDNFELNDIVRLALEVDQALSFRNGQTTLTTMQHEYALYIATSVNLGNRSPRVSHENHGIYLLERHPDSNDLVVKEVKKIRPKGKVLTASELDELRWRKNREFEDLMEQRRQARRTRFIRFPSDWQRREANLDRINKKRIEKPMQAGDFSGKNKSKKRS